MWTVKAIEDYCKATCEEYFNIEFNCTVAINPRLTSTLGRVTSKRVNGNKYVPYKMEFSKTYIECATYESVMDTIKHELCHYVATAISGESHNHDAYFKSLCRKIGCVDNGTQARHTKFDTPMPKKQPKYMITCGGCGGHSYYYKKCNVINYPQYYACSKCGCSELKVSTIR